MRMKHKIICIGRSSGSGGSVIAHKVSERLGIGYYDKNLLDLAKEHGGITSKSLDKSDEKATNPFYYKLLYEGNENVISERPATEMLQQLQGDVLKKLSETEDFIVVGRCADFVLKNVDADILSIFITAPMDFRVSHIMKVKGMSKSQAQSFINKTDKQRSSYYSFFTKGAWGKKDTYDMTINSAHLGIDGTTDLICSLYENYFKNRG